MFFKRTNKNEEYEQKIQVLEEELLKEKDASCFKRGISGFNGCPSGVYAPR